MKNIYKQLKKEGVPSLAKLIKMTSPKMRKKIEATFKKTNK